MRPDLAALKTEAERAERAGQNLLAACAGDIFPCDALAASVLGRTLSLIRGFQLLLESNSYTCAVALVRVQLDSALRFNGILTCRDPHMVAHQVFSGVPLRTIKHATGAKMTDKVLQGLLEKSNPWIPQIYSHASAYIHLSEQHFLHLLMQSKQDAKGTRHFQVSDEEKYIREDHRASLVETFRTITQSAIALAEQWIQRRAAVTDSKALKAALSVV